jgi:hypothetical protein
MQVGKGDIDKRSDYRQYLRRQPLKSLLDEDLKPISAIGYQEIRETSE